MSIIEEALRRVQDPVAGAIQPPAPAPAARMSGVSLPPPVIAQPEPAAAHSWTPASPRAVHERPQPRTADLLLPVTIAMMAMTAVLIGAGAWWLIRWHPMASPAAAPAPLPAPAPAASAPRPAPLPLPPKPAAPPRLRLTGVVEATDASEPYAMINNEIVGIGERVADATLMGITNGAVTLRRDSGEELVLRVSRTR